MVIGLSGNTFFFFQGRESGREDGLEVGILERSCAWYDEKIICKENYRVIKYNFSNFFLLTVIFRNFHHFLNQSPEDRKFEDDPNERKTEIMIQS